MIYAWLHLIIRTQLSFHKETKTKLKGPTRRAFSEVILNHTQTSERKCLLQKLTCIRTVQLIQHELVEHLAKVVIPSSKKRTPQLLQSTKKNGVAETCHVFDIIHSHGVLLTQTFLFASSCEDPVENDK